MAKKTVMLTGLGDRIDAQLKLNRMTLRDLSKRTGVAWKTAWTWKKGSHNPSLYSLRLIAKAFGCSVEYLVGEFDG